MTYDPKTNRAKTVRIREILTGDQLVLDFAGVDFWTDRAVSELIAEAGAKAVEDPADLELPGAATRNGRRCARPSGLLDNGRQPSLLLDTTVLTWLTDPRNPRVGPDRPRANVGSLVRQGRRDPSCDPHRWLVGGSDEQPCDTAAGLSGDPGHRRRRATICGTAATVLFKQIGDNDLWIAACALIQPEPLSIATREPMSSLSGSRLR
jgi:hypothetical protein